MSVGNDHYLYRSAKILRFLIAPLVLFALAALILVHNSRADELAYDSVLSDENSNSHPDAHDEFVSDEEITAFTEGTLPALSTPAPSAPGKDPWDTVLDQKNGNLVRFGVKLGGKLPFERNAQEAFVPASVTKLFTAAAALEKLGAHYRYKTTLSWQPSGSAGQVTDLTVTGMGDPTWGIESLGSKLNTPFDNLTALLVKGGVREVLGSIRFASPDSRWNAEELPTGWLERDLISCNGSLPRAFNLAMNCATLVIRDRENAVWNEDSVPTPVRLALTPGPKTLLRVTREGRGIVIEGTWAKGARARRLALPVYDPATWGHRLLLKALKRAKIRLSPAPARKLASTSEKSAVMLSPPLREILKPFLKSSINIIGQNLLIAMGGTEALQSYVATHLSIQDAASVQLYDGSGLSRTNQVSPTAVYSFLAMLLKTADFGLIWRALPIAGVDGTLGARMRGTAAEGVLRGKTGTLWGVYNLAGYVPRFNAVGEAVSFTPFVMLTRTTSQLRYVALAAHNRVGVRLSTLGNQ